MYTKKHETNINKLDFGSQKVEAGVSHEPGFASLWLPRAAQGAKGTPFGALGGQKSRKITKIH